jgi:hypothetical protein
MGDEFDYWPQTQSDWTRPQKIRWSLAWLGGIISYATVGISLNLYVEHRFTNIKPHFAVAVQQCISIPAAALLVVILYRVVLVRLFPDSKSRGMKGR